MWVILHEIIHSIPPNCLEVYSADPARLCKVFQGGSFSCEIVHLSAKILYISTHEAPLYFSLSALPPQAPSRLRSFGLDQPIFSQTKDAYFLGWVHSIVYADVVNTIDEVLHVYC